VRFRQLAGKFAAIGLDGTIAVPVIDAYRRAVADAQPEDMVYVGGSTFVVADLLKDL
jgi:dihydrofolate synthase/folylpolyglutamate synthase